MLKFLGDTFRYYILQIGGGVLAVFVTVTIVLAMQTDNEELRSAIPFVVLIGSIVGGVGLTIAYYRWVKTWEGRVIKKVTKHHQGHGGGEFASKTRYLIYIRWNRTVITKALRESDWQSITEGDYIVKPSHSYQFESRRQ